MTKLIAFINSAGFSNTYILDQNLHKMQSHVSDYAVSALRPLPSFDHYI